MNDLIQDISLSLEGLSTEKRRELAKKSYPTKMRVMGVPVPSVKLVLKELQKQTKNLGNQQKLALIKQLIDQNVFEMQQLAFEYLQSEKNLYKSVTKEYIESIEENLDNWISVDYFGAIVVGCAWRENLISTEKVKQYLMSENFWTRRVAVVATISLNQKARGGRGDSKRTLEICELVIDDHQEMVVKALSWALRELAKIDKDPVAEFITEHSNRLNKRVLREVRSKIETGLKN